MKPELKGLTTLMLALVAMFLFMIAGASIERGEAGAGVLLAVFGWMAVWLISSPVWRE